MLLEPKLSDGPLLKVWPQMKPAERIAHVRKFALAMKAKREELVNILMWEICKNRSDSEKEVDRTVQYIQVSCREVFVSLMCFSFEGND